MVITAAHHGADGRPVRYMVENSWDVVASDKGLFVMTDRRVTDLGLPIGEGTHMGADYLSPDLSIK